MCGERGLRGRGDADEGDLARPESPSRCTFPITALRVMPPSSAAICEAERPSPHSFFSVSTRSSVQVIAFLSPGVLVAAEPLDRILLRSGQRSVGPTRTPTND